MPSSLTMKGGLWVRHSCTIARLDLSGASSVAGMSSFAMHRPLLVKEFSDAVDSGDQVTAEKGDFGWYLEALSVDKQMRGRGVGRWLVSQVLPDYVAKRGGRVWICDVHRRECTLLPQWRV